MIKRQRSRGKNRQGVHALFNRNLDLLPFEIITKLE